MHVYAVARPLISPLVDATTIKSKATTDFGRHLNGPDVQSRPKSPVQSGLPSEFVSELNEMCVSNSFNVADTLSRVKSKRKKKDSEGSPPSTQPVDENCL